MSEIVYAFTSKGTKEKCSKNGVGCVRHPVHLVGGKAAANTPWFGNGAIAGSIANEDLSLDTCSYPNCENYVKPDAVADASQPQLCPLHFYSKEEEATVDEYAPDYVDPDSLSTDYNTRAAALRRKNVREVRTLGLGSGFSVIDPKDGVKGDDSIWFGTCDNCGETVSNDKRLGLWEHRTVEGEKAQYSTSCPKGNTPRK
jgi:hypothetical protein